jgi:hypothetical protein
LRITWRPPQSGVTKAAGVSEHEEGRLPAHSRQIAKLDLGVCMEIAAGILGTGSELPEKVITNLDLEKMVDTSDQ